MTQEHSNGYPYGQRDAGGEGPAPSGRAVTGHGLYQGNAGGGAAGTDGQGTAGRTGYPDGYGTAGPQGYGAAGQSGYGTAGGYIHPQPADYGEEAQAAARARLKAAEEARARAREEEARRRKKRKRITIAAVLAIIVGAVLGWYFLYYTKTPQYAVKLIRKSVNEHDVVAFQTYTDLDSVLSKGFGAVREAEWENGVTHEYNESDKEEYIKHEEQVIMNGVMNGDWDDPYKKTDPDRALRVDWESLTLKDVEAGKVHGDEALVNIRLENPSVGTDTLVLRMKKGPQGSWQLHEITNLKGYYSKVLQKTGAGQKQGANQPGGELQKALGEVKDSPVGPIYEKIREKVLDKAGGSESGSNSQNGAQEGSTSAPQARKQGGSSQASLEEQRQAVEKILNHPVVGKLAGLLVDHQDEIMAKLDELSQAVASGQADAAITEKISGYETELKRIGKILDFISRFL